MATTIPAPAAAIPARPPRNQRRPVIRTAMPSRCTRHALSCPHRADWPAKRHRHCRCASEADDQIGPRIWRPQPSRKFGADRGHPDRLVHMRGADAQDGRLQRKTLEVAPDLDPVFGVRPVADKDGDSSRGPYLVAVLVVLGCVRNTILNRVDPIHSGKTGLPEQAPKRPSPVSMALAGLKRSQWRSS